MFFFSNHIDIDKRFGLHFISNRIFPHRSHLNYFCCEQQFLYEYFITTYQYVRFTTYVQPYQCCDSVELTRALKMNFGQSGRKKTKAPKATLELITTNVKMDLNFVSRLISRNNENLFKQINSENIILLTMRTFC